MGPVRPSEVNPNGILYSSPGFPNPGSASSPRNHQPCKGCVLTQFSPPLSATLTGLDPDEVATSPGLGNPGLKYGIPSGFTSLLWALGRGSRQKLTPIVRMTRLEHSVARQWGGRKRNFNGEKLWARGYAISTVGFEEKQIRKYIRHQEITSTVRTTACSNE